MASTISKRQQARNERALQELIKTVPGNDRCADCGARNPSWASWNIGVFLCLRCATLHRKLGTHISKVKSLSMDTWTAEQVESMRRAGNAAVNRLYNPKNAPVPILHDLDAVDAEMERFIRKKYEQRAFQSSSAPRSSVRHDTGSSSSDDPPPLPPKPGFRSATSPPATSSAFAQPKSPPAPAHRDNMLAAAKQNKPSRVFGASVADGSSSSQSKMNQLKQMGFSDETINAAILISSDGSLDRAVETMVAVGDRSPAPPPRHDSMPANRAAEAVPVRSASLSVLEKLNYSNPFSTGLAQHAPSPMNGLQHQQQQQYQHQSQPPGGQAVMAPFPSNGSDSLSAQELFQTPQTDALQSSFRGLQISSTLFPNLTGDVPPAYQHNVFLPRQTQTPPAMSSSSVPPPLHPPAGYYYEQPRPSFANGNPFLQPSTITPVAAAPPTVAAAGYGAMQHPFNASPSPLQTQVYQPAQSWGIVRSAAAPALYHQQQQQQPTPLAQQRTGGRVDKSSILALYNYPHLAPAAPAPAAPSPSHFPSPPSATTASTAATMSLQPDLSHLSAPPPPPASSADTAAAASAVSPFASSTPSSSSSAAVSRPQPPQPPPPRPGNRNPFSRIGAMPPADAGAKHAVTSGGSGGGGRHVSQDSMDLGSGASGRHSPDAFASLSARAVR